MKAGPSSHGAHTGPCHWLNSCLTQRKVLGKMQICGVCYQKESLRGFFLGFLELEKIVDVVLAAISECKVRLGEIPRNEVQFEFCRSEELERVTHQGAGVFPQGLLILL